MEPASALVALLFAFGLIVAALFTDGRKPRSGRKWTPRYHERPSGPRLVYDRTTRMPDAADQLRAVENARFGRQPLLRHEEGKVFAAAEAAVREAGLPWRVFAQVSLGEVLTCPDRDGFNAINAKRVDLLLAEGDFTPIAAIEYQGTGHHLGRAAARDAVKKEALRKAGIGYIEITHHDGPDDVRRAIGKLAFAHTLRTGKAARRA